MYRGLSHGPPSLLSTPATMTHHDHDKHGHDQKHHHGKSKAKTSWLVWIGVVLMLGAMLMYVLSDDEAIQPGGPPPGAIDSAPVEAAP